ncbi:hypothetical protein [Larkinella soli]|uniref:hypothetical protein n=1 Tax=Larkinella soli TaxID=1770527 RepID=UPI000FFC6A90|nr:hypothetical protein [Larkinella soli]
MKPFRLTLGLAWVLFSGIPLQGQDLGQVLNTKPGAYLKQGVQVSGSLSADHVFYGVSGMERRRDPFTFFYSGQLNIKLFGKIDMPTGFMFTNQNFRFSNPFQQRFHLAQPFNRLSLRPSYKGITLHLGTSAMSFSPFTLAGRRFEGAGLEYRPTGKSFYLSAIAGVLQRAVRIDTTHSVAHNLPAYRQVGFGFQVGYRNQNDQAELILFTAANRLRSLPYTLDSLRIAPVRNAVVSVKLAKALFGKWHIGTEVAVSGLTSDQRLARDGRSAGFFESFGGLLPVNAGTRYQKAVRAEVGYQGTGFSGGLEYSRVDPTYRTLGAYYFNNNLENLTANATTQLLRGKISLSANAGLQRDNLDGSRFQTMRRFAGSAQVSFNPSDVFNINLLYSNFLSYSNLWPSYEYLTQVTPYDALDTLNYRQISQNVVGGINYQLPSPKEVSRRFSANLLYQTGADRTRNRQQGTRLYNASLSYTHSLTRRNLAFSAALNLSQNELPSFSSRLWGPTFSLTKALLDKKLRISGSVTYSRTSTRLTEDRPFAPPPTGRLWNTRITAGYAPAKRHLLQLSVVGLSRPASGPADPASRPQPPFRELTATLGYRYQFTVFDTRR